LARYDEALSDANRAIAIGGRAFLRERGAVEEASGNYQSAIRDFTECLRGHELGPETRELRLSLASVYLKDKQYERALQAADDSMVNTKNTTRSIFLRGKAEAGLGKLVAAKRDGNLAAQQYFDQARIVLRDEVLAWLKEIPAEREVSLGAQN
jgi:outer membrane protein assembly factor BamD (BamD/ComL family)